MFYTLPYFVRKNGRLVPNLIPMIIWLVGTLPAMASWSQGSISFATALLISAVFGLTPALLNLISFATRSLGCKNIKRVAMLSDEE